MEARARRGAGGRAWRMLLATSWTRIVDPRFLIFMASCDDTSLTCQALFSGP
jgi:hypothetical protein